MSEPPNERVTPSPSSNRDRSIALGVAVVSVLLVFSFWIISRNAPSALQQESVVLTSGDVSGEQGCQNFAEFWSTGTGVNISVETIESLTNCRQGSDGAWFVPSDAEDPRLTPRSRSTSDSNFDNADLAEQLRQDLVALEASLPGSLIEQLDANYDAVNQPVFGHTKRGRTDLTVKRNRYARITQAFLIDPDRSVVADYVGWVMARKIGAVDSFEASCRADPDLGFIIRACAGIRNEFAVSSIPLYWDLQDPVLISEYLIYRGNQPLLIPSPTPDPVT